MAKLGTYRYLVDGEKAVPQRLMRNKKTNNFEWVKVKEVPKNQTNVNFVSSKVAAESDPALFNTLAKEHKSGNLQATGQTMPPKSMDGVVEPNTSSPKRFTRAAYAKKRNKLRAERYRELLETRGPEAVARAEAAKDISFLGGVGIQAFREMEKLGAGTMNIVDFLRYLIPGQEDKAMASTSARAKEQEYRDMIFRELDEATPLSGAIGRTLPYVLEGVTVAPVVSKGVRTVYSGVKEGVKQGVKTPSRGLASRIRSRASKQLNREKSVPGVDKISDIGLDKKTPIRIFEYGKNKTGDKLTELSRELEEKVIDPMSKTFYGMGKRPALNDYYIKDAIPQVATAAGLGLIEGGLHYDDTMLEGLTSSLMGHVAGRTITPYVSKGQNRLTKEEKDVIDDWKTEGYRVDPGMASGKESLQAKHNDMRRSGRFRNIIGEIDQSNKEVVDKVAGRAMGMDYDSFSKLTKDSLNDHMNKLSTKYNILEEISGTDIPMSEITSLKKFIDLNSKTLKKSDLNAIENLFKLVRNPRMVSKGVRGKKPIYVYDPHTGAEYQNAKSIISKAKSEAYGKGDNIKGDIYSEMISVLDRGMERGLKNQGTSILPKLKVARDRAALNQDFAKIDGYDDLINSLEGKFKSAEEIPFKRKPDYRDREKSPTVTNLWKDLNEQYAISKLVMNKGMNSLNQIDMPKLSQHLMASDSERLLRGKGGRISDLHKIVKLHQIKNKQFRSGFGDENVAPDSMEAAPSKNMISTPAGDKVGLYRRARMIPYMAGYPAKTGLLNLPVDGPYSPKDLLRSFQQGGDYNVDTLADIWEWTHDNVVEGPVGDATAATKDYIKSLMFPEQEEEGYEGY